MKENRIDHIIKSSLVKEVLPEYFASSYPNLIAFIETYYDYMDSDGQFNDVIKDLYDIRDIGTTKLSYIDNMFEEFALGMGQEFFNEPREVLRNFAKFFRVKGSLYSAKGFFRSFYNDTTSEIIYPKKDLFMVGDSASEIGPHSTKVIQDGGVYQVLSVLIRSKTSLGEYEDFYRKFVHPAGFHLAAEMEINTDNSVTIKSETPTPTVDPDLAIEDSSHKFSMEHVALGCTAIVPSGNCVIIEVNSGAFDPDKILYIDDSSGMLEWGLSYDASIGNMYGPTGFSPSLITHERVNSKPLTQIQSSIDSNYYASGNHFRDHSLDSIDIGALTVQNFCFQSAAANAPYDSVGNSLNFPAPRYRTIKEFCDCKGDSNYINTKYSIGPTLISDIKGKTIQETKDALI